MSKEELDSVKKTIDPSFDIKKYNLKNSKWIFRLFKIYYQKSYENEYEEMNHFEIFKKNLKLMNRINSENRSFKVRINKFADIEDIVMPQGLMANLITSNEIETNNFFDSEYFEKGK